jgi:hypothetical protein
MDDLTAGLIEGSRLLMAQVRLSIVAGAGASRDYRASIAETHRRLGHLRFVGWSSANLVSPTTVSSWARLLTPLGYGSASLAQPTRSRRETALGC